MELSKREKRRLRIEKLRQQSHEAQQEHEQRLEQHKAQEQSRPKSKWIAMASVIGIVLIAIIAYSAYYSLKPGQYDGFAKCLSGKGAVMYGAMNWCKYTQAQKGMFGKSFKYINYHEYAELPGITITPTWIINGEWHENVQSFDRLAALTGCRL